MTANKMPVLPEPKFWWKPPTDTPLFYYNDSEVMRANGFTTLHTADQMRAMWLAGVEDSGAENAKLREMLADCTAYVAARDDYDREAEKYGHESNRGPMLKVRAAVLAAVKKYRIVLANLSALEQEAKR